MNVKYGLRSCYGIAFLAGLVYAGIGRLLFAVPGLQSWFEIVTLSFVFLVPLAAGSIIVFIGSKEPDWGWRESLGIPFLVILTGLLGTLVFGWEALFCILLASLVILLMAMIGGAVTYAIVRRNRSQGRALVSILVLLPYAMSPLENRAAMPNQTVTADTRIEIKAPPATVWNHIIRVSSISPSEIGWNPVYSIGFPHPVEATLSHEGVGGVRHATFERHVLFIETVTDWKEREKISFTIHAAGDFVPPATYDRNLTRGGQFFEVLSGTYWIEPLSADRVILHLYSQHRVSTRFNWYTALWTDWIMDQIQGSILHVIKRRCEDEAEALTGSPFQA